PRLSPGQRVGIVGAGFIGLELAATARTLGAEVTLVEAAPRPLARLLPAAFAFEQIELHRARGVQVLLGQAVERIAPGRIHLTDGRSVDADTIVVGIGACANAELAAAAGLAVRDGIVVDAAGRSSDPAIHAVGDAARHVDAGAGLDHRLESWRNAEDGAQAAAASILGLPPPRPPVPWFWTDQYGRNIQIAGRPDDGHRCVVLDTPDDGPRLACYLDGSARLRGRAAPGDEADRAGRAGGGRRAARAACACPVRGGGHVIASRAAILTAPGSPFVVDTVEVAPPRPGEVLVEIAASGLCHTDLTAIEGSNASCVYPAILGHEGAGRVVEVGPEVRGLAVGDHVIPLYGPECGACRMCLSRRTNL